MTIERNKNLKIVTNLQVYTGQNAKINSNEPITLVRNRRNYKLTAVWTER
jgi:hypothetical protein